MPFEKITSEKLSHSVSRQIELLILRGILRPGLRRAHHHRHRDCQRQAAERTGRDGLAVAVHGFFPGLVAANDGGPPYGCGTPGGGAG